MKGYKVFNKNWTCRGFQYEVGKTYEMEKAPVCCDRGFHFCGRLVDCFNYYGFDSENKVAEVEALGAINDDGNEKKYCTNKIRIVRELTWYEVLDLVNTEKNNTGRKNSGPCNTGDDNTGYRNTGDNNTGNRNTGDYNVGYYNTGHKNTGDCNTGCCNRGNGNTGCWNTGNRNTGDWNIAGHSTGCFNTKEEYILFFNKPSDWTHLNWTLSKAKRIMDACPCTRTVWVGSISMTDSEKKKYPTWECTGGYLKTIFVTDKDKQEWWDNLNDEEREEVMSIPNFDKEIFKEITGIEVR